MAIIEHQYEKVTHKDVEDCVKWCQNVLNLRDWEVTLDTNSEIPRVIADVVDGASVGGLFNKIHRLRSFMWIPLDRLKAANQNPLETVIHEMLHVLCNVTDISQYEHDAADMDNAEDCLIFRLESPLFRLYCLETGREVPEPIDYYWETLEKNE